MIETMEQWNDRLEGCGCCPMPTFKNEFFISTKSQLGQSSLVAYRDGGDFYQARRFTYSEGGYVLERYTGQYRATLAGISVHEVENIITTVEPLEGDEGLIFEEPITLAEIEQARLDARSSMIAGLNWAVGLTYDDLHDFSSRTDGTGDITDLLSSFIFMRFRFRVESHFQGSYFKFTYDIAEFPTVGAPSFISQDNVVEWIGPGTGGFDDPSWYTPWIDIYPPIVAGQRRIVNLRFTAFHGTIYGMRPEVKGELLEL